jgi:predicted O-methyltransferase YrrM
MTIGIFNRKGRLFLTMLLNCYNCYIPFMNVSVVVKLPKISNSDVISSEQITIVEPHSRYGNVDLDELAIINGIVLKEKPKKIFEIGTFDGKSTLNIAYHLEDDGQIYTLDLPEKEFNKIVELGHLDHLRTGITVRAEKIMKTELKCKNRIKRLYGDSLTFDFKPFYNSIDFVFVDGDHNYNYAFNDSEIALKLIGLKGGVILWHDYRNNVGVVSAIESTLKIHPDLNIYHIEGTSLAYCKILPSDVEA